MTHDETGKDEKEQKKTSKKERIVSLLGSKYRIRAKTAKQTKGCRVDGQIILKMHLETAQITEAGGYELGIYNQNQLRI